MNLREQYKRGLINKETYQIERKQRQAERDKSKVKPLTEEGFIISRGQEVPIAYEIEGKKYITSAVSAPTKGRWGIHNDIYFGHFKVGTGEQITKAHIDKGIELAINSIQI